eukprot:XP_017946863.1 PREDICTED: uncharacterized protein LOC108645743 [Xenopus tropicalis]
MKRRFSLRVRNEKKTVVSGRKGSSQKMAAESEVSKAKPKRKKVGGREDSGSSMEEEDMNESFSQTISEDLERTPVLLPDEPDPQTSMSPPLSMPPIPMSGSETPQSATNSQLCETPAQLSSSDLLGGDSVEPETPGRSGEFGASKVMAAGRAERSSNVPAGPVCVELKHREASSACWELCPAEGTHNADAAAENAANCACENLAMAVAEGALDCAEEPGVEVGEGGFGQVSKDCVTAGNPTATIAKAKMSYSAAVASPATGGATIPADPLTVTDSLSAADNNVISADLKTVCAAAKETFSACIETVTAVSKETDTNCANEALAAGENPDPMVIAKALRTVNFLKDKKRALERDIERGIANIKFAKGEARALGIRKLAIINKELEEADGEIEQTMLLIKPWEEVFKNRTRFDEMQQAGKGGKSFEAMYMDFVLRGEEEGTGKGQSAVISVPKPSDVPSVSNPPTSNPPTSNPPTSNPPTSNPSNPIVSASSVDNGNNMLVTPDNVLGKANKVANPTKSMEMSNAGGEDQGSKGFWEKRRFFARQQETLFDGPVFKRINVVKIKWDGEKEKMPGSRYICKNLIKESMGFTPSDVNAFITVSDVEFEVSFKLPQGLDRFWSLYQEKGRSPEWEGFRAIPVSKPEVKNVTVIFKNESIPPEDVLVWLKRQCKVLAPLTRLYNEEGFWIVGWKVQVRLDVSNNVTKHLPNSFFIGKERGVCFYPGQPKQCFKCGSKRHLANDCTLKVCALCGAQGHVSKECNKVRCNLCNDLGHTHRECPEAWHNIVRECPRIEKEFFQEEVPRVEVGVCEEITNRKEGGEVLSQTIEKDGGEGIRREVEVEKEGWEEVGRKTRKMVGKMVFQTNIETSNRFELPDGKSWGDMAEEEEEELSRLEDEEREHGKETGKKQKKKKGKRKSKASLPLVTEEMNCEIEEQVPSHVEMEITEDQGKKRKGRTESDEERESIDGNGFFEKDSGPSSGLGKPQYKRFGEGKEGRLAKSPKCQNN